MNYLRYIGVFIGTAAAVAVALWLLRTFAGKDFSSAGTIIIPPMIAAMVEGQTYAKAHGAKPSGGPAWRFAFVATVISAVLTAILYALVLVAQPEMIAAIRAEMVGEVALVFVGLGVFMLAMTLLVNRLFLFLGAGNQLKAGARRKTP